ARLRSAVTPRTRAIVINTPNNPTGRVFDPNEMAAVAELCIEHDLLAITDEIYEHIVFTGRHIPLAGMPGMRERTIVISGLSKTFSVTGWRVGTIVAPPVLTGAMRKVHDFLTVGAPAPLQEACAAGLDSLGRDYYEGIARDYRKRRDILWRGLRDSGFGCTLPEGAYYIMADFSALSELDDMAFSTYMARECGVAPVPGSSFYSRPERGAKLVRFAFCKQAGTLERAVERLRSFFGNP
ncbi:MAG: aminotransferase class I/II-fold pyridoxal phosphate-dependent enzyme, partial [Gemmatimonadetes bacterium]|nr:aminotransferase class I/II-fold pyridoxal phosphate-dependent enzyme [Gemmatimonadota bacterium]